MAVDLRLRGDDRIAQRVQRRDARAGAVLLQPQPLAQHFLEGVADRVGGAPVEAVDLAAGQAESRLERVRRIQHPCVGVSPPAHALRVPEAYNGGGQDGGQQKARECGHGWGFVGSARQSAGRAGAGQTRNGGVSASGLASLTVPPAIFNIQRLMSAQMPEIVDAWRMVATRSRLEGRLALSSMPRLSDALADTDSVDAVCSIEFGQDALQTAFAELRIEAELPLMCQRSLRRFVLPVQLVQRLGLIRDEADEAGLLPDVEALLVPEDGMLAPATMVEDELILAIPVIPVAPGSESVERDWLVSMEEESRANPFAALAGLKKDRNN